MVDVNSLFESLRQLGNINNTLDNNVVQKHLVNNMTLIEQHVDQLIMPIPEKVRIADQWSSSIIRFDTYCTITHLLTLKKLIDIGLPIKQIEGEFHENRNSRPYYKIDLLISDVLASVKAASENKLKPKKWFLL